MKTTRYDGEKVIPPTRLCLCGHVFANHSRGPCGVARGCECPEFFEDRNVPKLAPDSSWLMKATVNPHVHHSRNPQ